MKKVKKMRKMKKKIMMIKMKIKIIIRKEKEILQTQVQKNHNKNVKNRQAIKMMVYVNNFSEMENVIEMNVIILMILKHI